MSVAVQRRSQPLGIPARILVVGNDLLAGALAGALEASGFATRHILAREPEIQRGIEWRPNLVLIDVHLLDLASGMALIGQMRRFGFPVCVIDTTGDGDRSHAWMEAGTSAVIDGSGPFDRLFRTISRLLKVSSSPERAQRLSSSASTGTFERRQGSLLQLFADLTEREQVVLAELMEGHCAEEIATAALVSISTVRSQIKAILQKLGVNSQLAAVAKARRAGWSLDSHPGSGGKPLGRGSNRPGVA